MDDLDGDGGVLILFPVVVLFLLEKQQIYREKEAKRKIFLLFIHSLNGCNRWSWS